MSVPVSNPVEFKLKHIERKIKSKTSNKRKSSETSMPDCINIREQVEDIKNIENLSSQSLNSSTIAVPATILKRLKIDPVQISTPSLVPLAPLTPLMSHPTPPLPPIFSALLSRSGGRPTLTSKPTSYPFAPVVKRFSCSSQQHHENVKQLSDEELSRIMRLVMVEQFSRLESKIQHMSQHLDKVKNKCTFGKFVMYKDPTTGDTGCGQVLTKSVTNIRKCVKLLDQNGEVYLYPLSWIISFVDVLQD